MMAPPVRPADYPFPAFVDAGAGENVRVVVSRLETGGYKVRLRLRDDRGRELVGEQTVEPAPGHALLTGWKTAGQKTRVVLNVQPTARQSAAGCTVAAELIDEITGKTTRHIPLSVAETSEPGQPKPPARSRNGANAATVSSSTPVSTPVVIQPPLGLPLVPFPADNPPTVETIALGRRLYYDTNLSRDRTESCASCHDPAAGFRDPRRVSQGINGMQGERQSMSITNTA